MGGRSTSRTFVNGENWIPELIVEKALTSNNTLPNIIYALSFRSTGWGDELSLGETTDTPLTASSVRLESRGKQNKEH